MPRLRRTFMVTPIWDGHKLDRATQCAVDAIVLDLEDGVHHSRKAEARERILELLRTRDWNGKETVVRVNPMNTEYAEADIRGVAPGRPDAILVAKLDTAAEIIEAERVLNDTVGPDNPIRLWGFIESAKGLVNVEQIAFATPRLEALVLGPGDLSADLKLNLRRYTLAGEEGLRNEILYAQGRVVAACRAAGISPITGTPTNIRDDDGTFFEAQYLFRLGFDTVATFTPKMVDQVNRAYVPSPEDVEWARRVLGVEDEKDKEATTFAVLDGAMVDGPFYRGARNIMERLQTLEASNVPA